MNHESKYTPAIVQDSPWVHRASIVLGLVLAGVFVMAANDDGERFWPQWRGPHATGVSRHAQPPVRWSETSNIRWKTEIPGRGSATPVIWGNQLFLLTAVPVGVSSQAAHYQLQRLATAPNVFASPVGAAGRIYITGREGSTMVLKHGPTFEVLAENQLDDGFDASPALVDDQIFLRGYRYLYCLSENRGSPTVIRDS